MKKEKLKLFVWENVLYDYSRGIAFAYAENSSEARQLVIKELGYEHSDLCREPIEVKNKKAFYVYGGG